MTNDTAAGVEDQILARRVKAVVYRLGHACLPNLLNYLPDADKGEIAATLDRLVEVGELRPVRDSRDPREYTSDQTRFELV